MNDTDIKHLIESVDLMIDKYDEMAVDLAKYCGVLIKADNRNISRAMVSTEEARKYADWTAYCQIVQVLNNIREIADEKDKE